MAPEEKEITFSEKAPPTQVLSETKVDLTPEERKALVGEGLAKEEKEKVPESETIKPEQAEEAEKPEPELKEEEIPSEEEPPPKPEEEIEEPEEEVTHDPLKDTKRALTKSQEQVIRLKKILEGTAVKDSLTTRPEHFDIPEPPKAPIPDELDSQDATAFYQNKLLPYLEERRLYDQAVEELSSFVETHPDYRDVLPKMQEIATLYPELRNGRRSLHKIYNLAILYETVEGIQDGYKKAEEDAKKVGAKLERTKIKDQSAFKKPGAGIGKVTTTIPDFTSPEWTPEKIEAWAYSHGLAKRE